MGRRNRKQCDPGACASPAQKAGQGPDPDRPCGRLHDRPSGLGKVAMSLPNAPHASASASWSVRSTMLTILLLLTIGVWGVSTVILYSEARKESQKLFDQSLEETAHLLLVLADHE